MKKLFGQINMTWPKLIIFAVIAGVYTGVMAALPITKDTSFADISITFEWWVLFGIVIIVNSKTPLDSALKCIVFFLISQPLVYLVQVPFNAYGWGIFRYYPGWFVWTLCTFPMGFVGYFMRKNKWWSLLILVPILFFVGYHYWSFLREALSYFPRHLLSALFCAATLIIYPLFVFAAKRLRTIGLIVSLVIIAAATVLAVTGERSAYNTVLLVNNGSQGVEFDGSYEASLEDESFGEVYIDFDENIQDHMVKASFRKTGETKFILRAPDGTERVFRINVHKSSVDIAEITDSGG
ncbi:MAG: hypothetical protein K6C09_05550 [Oscillospiraceae bacterium]|nr:hypothetical protein [Oscillospiraceae bacterium]